MRVAYLAAGAGLTYCGACIRDLSLVGGLRERGHDVDLIALYTPLKGDTEGIAETSKQFYGGINVFLEQAAPVFRRLEGPFDRFLDSSALLNFASRFAVRTTPESLGPMTVSVLAGSQGYQKKELDRLLAYFRRSHAPDVVNITNSLLSGIAPGLKTVLKCRIICNVQGEDSFLAGIPEPYYSQSIGLMRENARHIDLFLAPSRAHGKSMAKLLQIPAPKLRVTRVGIDAEAFSIRHERPKKPFSVGYLSIIAPTKGLDTLVDAVAILVNEQKREIVLRIAGRVADDDFWKRVRRRLDETRLWERTERTGELDLAGKAAFLGRCSAFSVPSRVEESRGMAMMEAMASGVPVVAPSSGVFPELTDSGKCGVLYAPGDAVSLARGIAKLMDAPSEADAIGARAAKRISAEYSLSKMIDGVEAAYRDASSPLGNLLG